MNPARALAQTDPTANLSLQIGQEATRAKSLVADLARSLQLIDEKKDQLRRHGIEVTIDLGDIGNAAAAARRQVAAVKPRTTFSFPGPR